jgi:hypothetical protein
MKDNGILSLGDGDLVGVRRLPAVPCWAIQIESSEKVLAVAAAWQMAIWNPRNIELSRSIHKMTSK